jgi:hypothetical protein
MKRSIAIWPSLNGEVRLAAESSNGESVWRNGGTWGNSEKALQPDPEHDTLLLSTILAYFSGSYNAKTLSISHRVVVLKVKLRHLPGFLKELMQMLIADSKISSDDTTIRIPSRHPRVV